MYNTPKWMKVLQYLAMTVVALFMFFPIYWIFCNSLKTLTGISAFPPELFPSNPHWENYKEVLSKPSTLLYLRNTLILVVFNTVGTLISSSIVAYPLARMRFRGRGAVFTIIILTMMVPTATLIVPEYLMFRVFGMLDTFWPHILPSCFAQPYNVFLFRQFFISIPKDLDNAARIDGAGEFRIFLQIILPNSVPAILTVGMFNFMGNWNDLLWPLIMTSKPETRTITAGLAMLTGHGSSVTPYGVVMAGALISALPLIIVFFFVQKRFVEGIAMTGMK